MRILRQMLRCSLLATTLLALGAATLPGAPMDSVPVRPLAPKSNAPIVRPLLPFDLAIDALTVEWAPATVIRGVVRYQGSSKAALGEHNFSCHIGYGDFPPGAFDPPSGGGAYVFTPPARQEDLWTHFHLKEAGTYAVSIPFRTVANEVLLRCTVAPVTGEVDTANNTRRAFSHRVTQGQPQRYILDVNATPLNDPGKHLRVTTRMTNPTAGLLQNLRLILVRNHQPIKEWKPIGMHPSALATTHWDDDLPAEFATNVYEAILTTDTSNAQPAPATILDRRSISYRRPGTVHGTP